MSLPALNEIRVRRLRQPGNPRRREWQAARSPSRLAPEAVLCIRRVCTRDETSAVETEMENSLRTAARPAHGPVPAGANAVLFADRAELLACLARDWCGGEAAARWWWPVLFPKRDLASMVHEAWLAEVPAVPGALARLAATGVAGRFLGMLPAADLAVLWREVVRVFGLSVLDAAWSGADESAPDFPRAETESVIAPWSRWIDGQPQLRGLELRLLVSALLLVRAPAVVRSPAFARALARWRNAEAPGGARVPRAGDGVPPSRTFDGAASDLIDLNSWPVEKSSPRRDAATSTREACAPRTFADAPREIPTTDVPRRLENDAIFSPVDDEVMAPETGRDPERVASEWGGVFYLVNVALALGYYGDFTTPARPGLALPLWDFLALLGGQMIGDEFTADPLASLLARLSGRAENEPPGAWFEPPGGEPLTQWIGRTMDEIDARLATAFGLADVAALHALVLRHRAEIEATETRVDVHFSLAAHPLALRLAGLDRDPGWVPAGGRSIAFHYD